MTMPSVRESTSTVEAEYVVQSKRGEVVSRGDAAGAAGSEFTKSFPTAHIDNVVVNEGRSGAKITEYEVTISGSR